jgi:hypothetical protein
MAYGLALLIGRLALMPRFPITAAPFICAGLYAALAFGGWKRRIVGEPVTL